MLGATGEKRGLFSSSTINNFLWYSGNIDSEGEDPDNAKMPVYSGACHFSIKKGIR